MPLFAPISDLQSTSSRSVIITRSVPHSFAAARMRSRAAWSLGLDSAGRSGLPRAVSCGPSSAQRADNRSEALLTTLGAQADGWGVALAWRSGR